MQWEKPLSQQTPHVQKSVIQSMIDRGLPLDEQGMPKWAQYIGNLMPLTHFNRLIRGIFLKGNQWWDLWPDIWPIMMFTVVVMAIAVKLYRRTLD